MKRLSEAEFRNKITWMTFILSCLVVMIHSYNADLFINGEGTGVFAESVKQVQALVSLAVPSIAVPGFFIISSYLFFRDVSWGEIPDKMTRRVRSVLMVILRIVVRLVVNIPIQNRRYTSHSSCRRP